MVSDWKSKPVKAGGFAMVDNAVPWDKATSIKQLSAC